MLLILGRLVCCHGNKIFKLILCCTFSRTSREKIKYFCYKLAEISFFIIFSPWAKTPKIGFFVPIEGTSAIMEFFNLHLSKFKKIHDINAESVAILVK